MQRFLKFKLNRECREIAVNPDKVLYVCHYENGASALHFSKDCFVRVQGDLDEIVRRLAAASEESEPALPSARGEARLSN